MSDRLDHDEMNAMANKHIINALRTKDRELADEELARAEKYADRVLNAGKSQWDPGFIRPTTVTPPPEQ